MVGIQLPSDEERQMLRDSLRGLLHSHWSPENALKFARDQAARHVLWSKLVEQGLASLGSDPSEGGLREMALVMEELGRAACPVPFLGAALANLALAGQRGEPSEAAGLLDLLHGGAACISVAFATFDPDPHAGLVTFADGVVNGFLRFVESAGDATHLLVASREEGGLLIVTTGQPGVTITEVLSLGGLISYEVHLEGVKATSVKLESDQLQDLMLIARMLLTSRAYGASRRAFELVVDYVKERVQFGQPVGRFQAIQHKLANNFINLEGVRLTLANAAENYDTQVSHWRYFVSSALAFACGSLRSVSLETHHAFGAIGYAEDHEAPRHFRRVHLDIMAYGGVRKAREEVASYLLGETGKSLPVYDLGAEGNAFRDQVRAWLKENWTGQRKAVFDAQGFEKREFDPSFARDMGKTGWIGLSWAKQFGGQERSALEQLAFIEEMEHAEAPRVGAAIQANALMLFGTPEQQTKYLPEILKGEAMHGMGYSEPNAGSDLASLRTSAKREGDEWVINGQKIWTTTWWGKYMFLAARTDTTAKPSHAGISMFVLPMDAKGITVKPSKTMYDGSFANIFYDDVRLPMDALVGELNCGWKVLTSALATERGLIGGGIVCKVAHQFELLREYIQNATVSGSPLVCDLLIRDRLSVLAAEIEVGRQLMLECAKLASNDGITPPEYGAMSKVYSGELMERFGEAALDIIGSRATLSQGSSGALSNGAFEQGLRHSLMWVISIGTNEIQRSLIAQRGLGLPR